MKNNHLFSLSNFDGKRGGGGELSSQAAGQRRGEEHETKHSDDLFLMIFYDFMADKSWLMLTKVDQNYEVSTVERTTR